MTRGNAQQRRQRWLRYEWFRDPACRYCGRITKLLGDDEPVSDDMATCDHYVPQAKEGPDKPFNWRLSCRKCNADKGDMLPEMWLLVGEVDFTPPVIEPVEARTPTALEMAFRRAGLG
jgi:5-methylcytosine-specific restriction endonuclease McrA